jgi:tetratricopeptide (TPR) repeat protein
MPEGLDPTEPIAEVLHELRGLAESGSRLEGPALLAALGGASRLREALEELTLPASVLALAPVVHTPADAEKAPYFHLPKLAVLLAREAAAAEQGREYPHRVVVNDGKLLLLLRRRVAQQLPRHAIWLDATATGPYILLGKVLLKKGEADLSVRTLQRALSMDPNNFMAHHLMGEALRAVGRDEEAQRELEIAQKLQAAQTASAQAQQN